MTCTLILIVVSAIMCTGGHRTHHVGDIRRCHLATLFGAEKESSAGVHILPFAVSIDHYPSSQHFGLACCPSKSQTARCMLSIKMAGTRHSWMLGEQRTDMPDRQMMVAHSTIHLEFPLMLEPKDSPH